MKMRNYSAKNVTVWKHVQALDTKRKLIDQNLNGKMVQREHISINIRSVHFHGNVFPIFNEVLFNYSQLTLLRLHMSKITVSFKYNQISTLKREEQYTTTDFLAICGGLLGLCLGFSVLSIVEIVYFATVHLFWTLRRWKSDHSVIPIRPQKPLPVNHTLINFRQTKN